MTVCIAASCEHGKVIVAATDGALSYGGIRAETGVLKGWFFDDWLFMYSGEPSSADLISDEITLQLEAHKDGLNREKVRAILRRAFRRHLSLWASDAILSPLSNSTAIHPVRTLQPLLSTESSRRLRRVLKSTSGWKGFSRHSISGPRCIL